MAFRRYGLVNIPTGLAWSDITGTPTTLAGYGITDGVISSRTLTINGTTYDLSANRTWSVGTITSITASSPLTGGTITSSGSIGITQANTTTSGYLSSTDWNTFNGKFTLPSLTSGSVIFSNGTTLSQNNANFFWDNANQRLGIGTATPSAIFHSVGTVSSASLIGRGAYFNNTITATANNDVLVGVDINPTFTNGAFTGVTNYGARISGRIKLNGYTTTTSYIGTVVGYLAFDANGNILTTAAPSGINIYNSDGTLTGNRTITAPLGGNAIFGNNLTNYFGISLNSTLNSTDYNFSSSISDKHLYINAPTGNQIKFRINNIDKVLLSSTLFDINYATRIIGNLILGNSTSTNYQFNLFDSNSPYITFNNTNSGLSSIDGFQIGLESTGDVYFLNRENGFIRFRTNNIDRITITSAGRLLLGSTIESTYLLDVNGTSRLLGSTTFGTLGSGTGMFWDNTNNRLLINTATAIASEPLQVNGNIRANGTLVGGQTNKSVVESSSYLVNGTNTTRLLNLDGTWTTSGDVTAIFLNITNTGSGANSKLIDLQIGSAPKFTVAKDGKVRIGSYGSGTIVSASPAYNLAVDASGNVIETALPSVPISSITSGTYSPTPTIITNCSSIAAFVAQYMRVGDVVTVSGEITITPNSTTAPYSLYLTIPVNSIFTSHTEYASGVCNRQETSSTPGTAGVVYADASANNNQVVLYFHRSPSATSGRYTYTYTYRIIVPA